RDRKSNKPLINNSRNKKAVEIEATTTVQFRRLQSENDSSYGDDSTRPYIGLSSGIKFRCHRSRATFVFPSTVCNVSSCTP
ncbi:hypothetical protein RYX36_031924, partial [Vicia faba]